MAAVIEKPSSLVLDSDQQPPNIQELRQKLMQKKVSEKVAAMKQIITMINNGENLSQLFMTIIQQVSPEKDHNLRKLLLLYFEVIEKRGPDGKLKQEMILVCNALLTFLNHPNEFVRGSTLRFLCKLHEPELVENLLKAIKDNLVYRHAYVRRNAVLAVAAVFKMQDGLIPDAPELLENVLHKEADQATRRNAFLMLQQIDQDRALSYLATIVEDIAELDVGMQLAAIDLIRKVKPQAQDRGRFTRALVSLMEYSKSHAVTYEAAGSVVAMTSHPSVIRHAAQCYVDILCTESDNNVKLIVLEKLDALKREHDLQDLLMDMLRALNTPNIEIRQKMLTLSMDLVTTRNIHEVIGVLKKEVMKTQAKDVDRAQEYRQMLIAAIHSCAERFPEVADSVVYVLMDFLGDASGSASAADVVAFVREVLQQYPELRPNVISKLLETFYTIKAARVYRAVLWIIGEYCTTAEQIAKATKTLKESLGDLPFVVDNAAGKDLNSSDSEQSKSHHTASAATTTTTTILPDGTYGTTTTVAAASAKDGPAVTLRTHLSAGDFLVGSSVAAAFTKLALRANTISTVGAETRNHLVAEAILIMTSMLTLGRNPALNQKIDIDCAERISMCIQVLAKPSETTTDAFLKYCNTSFVKMLDERRARDADEKAKEVKSKERHIPVDSGIIFRQLRGHHDADDTLDDDYDIQRATGQTDLDSQTGHRFLKLHQLTGLSDPIYAEAAITVHQYDIVLDFLVVNRTTETLTNVSVELYALGDLKVTEKPTTYTLAPRERKRVKSALKVTSTESGLIFGNIAFDYSASRATDQQQVILQEIRIDITTFISPKFCTDLLFRNMWQEFEWENKVTVNTNITDVGEYLQHVITILNMRCLTPDAVTSSPEIGFVAANLYAKTIFDEHILANVSVEKLAETGRLNGFVRIRSKTQGVALGVGERITMQQRLQK
eukprot:TRINITY_DN6540_c0_g1_i1.p1 TRINITY_DN6540_c0_g1~~TRINITY_DN6540_c0_g1_i1.p1  ORF type:complete len:969 (+),score=240.95 TRINITY_DN6540_c0_g1_i1:62-2908(+)